MRAYFYWSNCELEQTETQIPGFCGTCGAKGYEEGTECQNKVTYSDDSFVCNAISSGDWSWRHYSRPMFWVGATADEVKTQIKPLLFSNAVWKEFMLRSLRRDEGFTFDGKEYFFLMNNQDAYLMWKIYPFSGMWNRHIPFIPIGSRDLQHPGCDWLPTGKEIKTIEELRDMGDW